MTEEKKHAYKSMFQETKEPTHTYETTMDKMEEQAHVYETTIDVDQDVEEHVYEDIAPEFKIETSRGCPRRGKTLPARPAKCQLVSPTVTHTLVSANSYLEESQDEIINSQLKSSIGGEISQMSSTSKRPSFLPKSSPAMVPPKRAAKPMVPPKPAAKPMVPPKPPPYVTPATSGVYMPLGVTRSRQQEEDQYMPLCDATREQIHVCGHPETRGWGIEARHNRGHSGCTDHVA